MKHHFARLTLGILLCSLTAGQAQETYPLPSFDKLVAGPRIALILEAGTDESLRLEFDQIDPDAINFEVTNGTLRIYLDHARNIERKYKTRTRHGKIKESIYADGVVNAFITYRSIHKLVVKGEEYVRVNGTISERTFKLKVFGDMEITFSELNTDRLKVKMYGDCTLIVETGESDRQKYTLFGDHFINTEHFHGRKIKAMSFGESKFRINAEQLKIIAFGEVDINCPTSTHLKKFVIGESSVCRFRD